MGWADNYIEKLISTGEVKFRPRGNSMRPRIKSGQLVTVKTYESLGTQPKKGDIVLCKVSGNQYLHLISTVEEKWGGNVYHITNNRGRLNGRVTVRAIYGCVTSIED